MQLISLPYVYDFGAKLQQLRHIPFDSPLKESLWRLLDAEKALTEFLNSSVYIYCVRACIAPGNTLLQAIKKLSTDDKERVLDFFDTYSITNALEKFEAVFTAEMNVSASFLVTKKRGYDTADLIWRSEVLFPSDFAAKLPECVTDIREAGRCIAFEMGTAAGFHIMRVLELCLRKYWDTVSNGQRRPDNASMGVYLRELEENHFGDEKVIAALRQVKDLHRNALIHPEVNLSLDDAIGLLGMSQSIIVAILKEIPQPPAPPLVLSSTGS